MRQTGSMLDVSRGRSNQFAGVIPPVPDTPSEPPTPTRQHSGSDIPLLQNNASTPHLERRSSALSLAPPGRASYAPVIPSLIESYNIVALWIAARRVRSKKDEHQENQHHQAKTHRLVVRHLSNT